MNFECKNMREKRKTFYLMTFRGILTWLVKKHSRKTLTIYSLWNCLMIFLVHTTYKDV